MEMKQLPLILLTMACLTSSLGLSAQEPADFVLPSIISDHAVMKRDSPVKLWGWCPAEWDLKIVCSWAEQDTLHVRSDKYNYWEKLVQTPKEEGPFSIRFFGWKNELCAEVKDILMGEPWLCSGQSNMEYPFRYRIDDESDKESLFTNGKIRVFKVEKASSRYPVERIQGKWELCTKERMDDFSAVAYYFGKYLNEGLGDVPVGLIGSYWGGTSIEPWMDDFIIRHEKLEPLTEKLQPSWAPTANSSLYNAMIHPVQNYRISGVVWYQGEANCDRYEDYGKMLSAMIRGWRRCFHIFLPFYMVQIAPYDGYSGKNAAYLREQQENIAKTLMNTGIVHIGDLVNDIHDIHPALKRQVGERLANLALYQTYDRHNLQPFSPEYESFEVKGKAIILKTTAAVHTNGKEISGFEIVDPFGNLHPAKASILKDGSIRLTAKDVAQPVGLRYCFDNASMPNLFGENGLPLAPFRTDK
jgi:sialate O-acetylesterase